MKTSIQTILACLFLVILAACGKKEEVTVEPVVEETQSEAVLADAKEDIQAIAQQAEAEVEEVVAEVKEVVAEKVAEAEEKVAEVQEAATEKMEAVVESVEQEIGIAPETVEGLKADQVGPSIKGTLPKF
ncbi:MAG: hypothetical protein ACSHX4_12065 [Opitutaceae bacterium]